jgi:hypothetical protein
MGRCSGHVRPEWEMIMNTDVEDLLREGMERFTATLRAPAGLTRLVTHRRRRRRLVWRSVAGAGAALTAALVALVVVGSGGPPVYADVAHRVDRALTAAEPGEIAEITVITKSGAGLAGPATVTTTQEWSYGAAWRSVTSSPPGHPVYDEGSTSASVYTLVSYLKKIWARVRLPRSRATSISGLHGCDLAVAALPLLFRFGLPGTVSISGAVPETVVGDLRASIACETLLVAGRQRVDGVEAIELTSPAGGTFAETIWVSPGTNLPVRMVVRSLSGREVVWQTADITWLRPTGANLADLTVPVPAGFRHIRLAGAIVPIELLIPGSFGTGPNGLVQLPVSGRR